MTPRVFKTPEGRDKIRTLYNEIVSCFPFEQEYIDTAYGKTFILTAGKSENPPVILLHGSCGNSAFWFPEIMALSENYRVYAVDIPGEPGNSDDNRLDLISDDYATWLKGVLDSLSINKASIVGNSLGGWMALKFATRYPAYVSNLILIATAGIAEIKPKFISDATESRLKNESSSLLPSVAGEQSLPRPVLDFLNIILENFNPIEELPIFSDAELLRLSMPILFIAGEDDVIIDAVKSAQRLTHLVPSSKIHLLAQCGHMVLNSGTYIIPFLQKAGSA